MGAIVCEVQRRESDRERDGERNRDTVQKPVASGLNSDGERNTSQLECCNDYRD